MRILADAEATSPSPGSHDGTARCRRSLTTTYYRRRTEESLGAFCRDQDLHLADLRRQSEKHHRDRKAGSFSKKGRLPRTLCDVQAILAARVQQDCEQ